jgi:hypothetical protein
MHMAADQEEPGVETPNVVPGVTNATVQNVIAS